MFPLHDTIKSRRKPVINNLIIAVNVFIFLYQYSLTNKVYTRFIYLYGLVPSNIYRQNIVFNIMSGKLLPFISSIFLHGSWMHLIGNMWFLYIFGDNVEDSMGHFKYLIFYLLGGALAGIFHCLVNPASTMPTIGASGAISAVMGAYFILYPHSKILTFIPLFGIIPFLIKVPSVIYLLLWFLSQLQSGTVYMLAAKSIGGVAWWAHIGGFVSGMILQSLFASRRYEY